MRWKTQKRLCIGSLLFVLLSLVIYIAGAKPFYLFTKQQQVVNLYKAISNMNLSNLDEDDEQALESYAGEFIGALILDDTFTPVYKTHFWGMDDHLDRVIRDHMEEYQENPTVIVDQRGVMSMIRLRGILHQDGDFYVYLRLEIRFIEDIIRNTIIYFGCVILLMVCVWCYVLLGKGRWRQSMEQSDMPENTEEIENLRQSVFADVTHELKTPLAVISSQVEMLETMGDKIDRDYYFDSIREEIEKMSDLIGKMLQLTIMEHHLDEMKLTKVNLTELMQYLILKYDALFRQNGIRFRQNIADNCYVEANQMYLEHAINNYIMNAFEHTDQGKKISITLQMEEQDAVIRVYNEGPQILPEEMDQIWSRFFSENENEQSSNAGLGLYQVKKIMEQHQGSYGVNNKADGVEFFIRVPRTKA